MQGFEQLNAPLQHLDTIQGVELWMKRDDLIHHQVSGNKWRKLRYFLEDFQSSGKESILSFGGAFSNHLAALAALGQMTGIPTHGLVRGEIHDNPTLRFCRQCGMELEAISRQRYRLKDDPEFRDLLKSTLPQVYVIPEGGKGPLGMRGCRDMVAELPQNFDLLAIAAGTGTTAAGILAAPQAPPLWVVSALRGGHFLKRAIAAQLDHYAADYSLPLSPGKRLDEQLVLWDAYHHGGFAKVSEELIDFMNNFHRRYQVALDPVYTGKLMYAVMDQLQRGAVAAGSKLLCIHTGGLQGIAGMNETLRKKGLKTLDYEI